MQRSRRAGTRASKASARSDSGASNTGVIAAVFVFLGSCMGPLESDRPGYSRRVLPAGTPVPHADDDYETNHKIEENDGLDEGVMVLAEGFAQGRVVHYWDLGAVKSSIAPAYFLTHCDGHGFPLPDQEVPHPVIWESVPGDPDYSPFRSLSPVCVTADYAGEVIPSAEALSDAIDMQLVKEPGAPTRWLNLPVIAVDIEPSGGLATRDVYAGGRMVEALSFESQEGAFAYADKRISAKNVYQVSFEGSEKVERVVFSHGVFDASGEHRQSDPDYAPAWKVIAVVVAKDADLTLFDRESALVSIDSEGEIAPGAPTVLSVRATGETVNRPHQVTAEGGPL